MFTARYGLDLYIQFLLLVVLKALIMHMNIFCTLVVVLFQ